MEPFTHRYNDKIINLTDVSKREFPEKFENEIYLTIDFATPYYEPVDYVSNFSIKYLIKGKEEYLVNNRIQKIYSNQMLIVNNKSEVVNLDAEGTAISVFINPEIVEDCYRNCYSKTSDLLDNPAGERYSLNFYDEVGNFRINTIDKLYRSTVFDPTITIPVDFYYEIAYDLIACNSTIQNQINGLNQQSKTQRMETYRRLEIGRRYLDSNLSNKFDLDEMARVSCLSKFHLIRCFRAAYGTTPHRYYLLRKMQLAREILLNQKESIKHISIRLGYPDVFTFSKQFKKFFGMSPGKFASSYLGN